MLYHLETVNFYKKKKKQCNITSKQGFLLDYDNWECSAILLRIVNVFLHYGCCTRVLKVTIEFPSNACAIKPCV